MATRTPEELFSDFLDCMSDLNKNLDRCVDLFSEDGVYDFPYLQTVTGMAGSFKGKAAIRSVLELIRSKFPSFRFSNVRIYETTDKGALFAEYHAEGVIAGTQTVYVQDYVSRLIAENGKLNLLREYFNSISSARSAAERPGRRTMNNTGVSSGRALRHNPFEIHAKEQLCH